MLGWIVSIPQRGLGSHKVMVKHGLKDVSIPQRGLGRDLLEHGVRKNGHIDINPPEGVR